MVQHLSPISPVAGNQFLVHLPATGTEFTFDKNPFFRRTPGIEFFEDLFPPIHGDQVEGFLMHRTDHLVTGTVMAVPTVFARRGPGNGVQGPCIGTGISLQSPLQQTDDGTLGTSDRTMKQKDPFFRPVPPGGGLEDIDHPHQGSFQTEDCISSMFCGIIKELVLHKMLLIVLELLRPVSEDHVVDPLKGTSGNLGVFTDNVEIVLKRTLPMEILEIVGILEFLDAADNTVFAHDHSSPDGSSQLQSYDQICYGLNHLQCTIPKIQSQFNHKEILTFCMFDRTFEVSLFP